VVAHDGGAGIGRGGVTLYFISHNFIRYWFASTVIEKVYTPHDFRIRDGYREHNWFSDGHGSENIIGLEMGTDQRT